MATPDPEDTLEVGVLTRPHGVRGGLRLHLFNPDSELLQQHQRLRVLVTPVGGEPVWRELTPSGLSAGSPVVRLSEVASREEADALRGAHVAVPRALLVVAEGEFLHADLVGFEVVDGTGCVVGEVVGTFNAGASDVMVIHVAEQECYVPLVEQWAEVRLEQHQIQVQDLDQFDRWPIG